MTPYTSSREHLLEELERIDVHVRAQTRRWLAGVGGTKPPDQWGMVNVSRAEVDRYLGSPFAPPGGASPEEAGEDDAAGIRERIDGRLAEPGGTPTRLEELRIEFELSHLDQDLLLTCLLGELDERYRRLYGCLQDNAALPGPTVELLGQILLPLVEGPEDVRRALAPDAPLVRERLVRVDGGADGVDPLGLRAVRVDDRIAAHLLDIDAIDERLAGIVTGPAAGAGWDELASDEARRDELRRLPHWLRGRLRAGRNAGAVLLNGPPGSGRLLAARAVATDLAVPLLVARTDAALASPLGLDGVVRLTYREARLSDAAVYWSGCERLIEEGDRLDSLLAGAEDGPGPVFLGSTAPWDRSGRHSAEPFVRIDFPLPPYDVRRRLWGRLLPPPAEWEAPAPDRERLAESLANAFQLTEGQMRDALATARGLAVVREPEHAGLLAEDLHDGCRRHSSRHLSTFGQRIEPKLAIGFKDLVLPPMSARQLADLRDRIRYRSRVQGELGFERRLPIGRGIVAIFTGTSGTGKTMAAQLLAGEQGVDLYKVDLSSVVSKYVGETEKNLASVFDEAENSNSIIFFDEADALFGKRSEVKDARDRWANIEINYLLQRVEEFAGVVILASNLRQNIDDAFLRRIHQFVEFPFPDVDSRLRIWQGMFPDEVGRPDDDELQLLSERFQLTGGSIKNIVVDGAFRALAERPEERTGINLRHLVASTAREYHKEGKPITRSQFGEPFYRWVEEDVLRVARE